MKNNHDNDNDNDDDDDNYDNDNNYNDDNNKNNHNNDNNNHDDDNDNNNNDDNDDIDDNHNARVFFCRILSISQVLVILLAGPVVYQNISLFRAEHFCGPHTINCLWHAP